MKRKFLSLVLASGLFFVLSGCNGIHSGTSERGGSGFCDVELLDVSPSATSESVILLPDFERTRTHFDIVALTWDQPPTLPSVEVVNPATGISVNGRIYQEEGVWYWWPTDYLDTETVYEVRVEVFDGCGQETVTQFTTDAYGAPADPSCFDGATFILGATEGDQLSVEPFLSSMALELRGAHGLMLAGLDGGQQDLCVESFEMGADAEQTDNPLFAARKEALVTRLNGMDMEIMDVTVSGMVSSDCETLGRMTLTATLDIAPAAVAMGVSIEEMCALASVFSSSDGCIPCEDGELHCMAVEQTGLTGSSSHLDLVEVSQSDIEDNSDCR